MAEEKKSKIEKPESSRTQSREQEGIDYYIDPESGLLVFTADYLLKRGYCCNNNCRHCPYKR